MRQFGRVAVPGDLAKEQQLTHADDPSRTHDGWTEWASTRGERCSYEEIEGEV